MAEEMEVRVLDITGSDAALIEVVSSTSIKEVRQLLAAKLECDWRTVRLLGAEGIAADTATVAEAGKAAEGQTEVSLTLVRCAPPVSVTGKFEQFEENWQVVPTAANDPHGTYLYDPEAQVVTRTEKGVILTSRGRVASRKEVELSSELVITGKFKFTGDRQDFLTVHYGVRPLHTGREPYGTLDDGRFGIRVLFFYMDGKISVDVADRSELLKLYQPVVSESECQFRIAIDPSADCVSVTLEHGGHEVCGSAEQLGLGGMTFPGRNLVIYNREFAHCHANLWDVEVFLEEPLP